MGGDVITKGLIVKGLQQIEMRQQFRGSFFIVEVANAVWKPFSRANAMVSFA